MRHIGAVMQGRIREGDGTQKKRIRKRGRVTGHRRKDDLRYVFYEREVWRERKGTYTIITKTKCTRNLQVDPLDMANLSSSRLTKCFLSTNNMAASVECCGKLNGGGVW